MGVTHEQREMAIRTAVKILGHPERDRLLGVLATRIRKGSYQDEGEREADRVAYAIAWSVVEQLARG